MSELFPNAPLDQAILEARFSGEIAIEGARSAIQEELRAEFPKLYVPRAVAGEAPALQAYVFRNDADSEGVEIALHRISYMVRKYEGFAKFRDRALQVISVFRRHVPQVQKLNRVGLRYVNHIPILRSSPSAAIPLRDYLNIGMELPPSIPANLTSLNSGFEVALDGGTLKVVVKNEIVPLPTQHEIIVLDFDFAQQNNLNIEHIAQYVELAHTHTKRVFEEFISQKYIPVMRGENE